MSFKLWLEATTPYVAKKVDPALLTFPEFYDAINRQRKSHQSSAYDWPLSSFRDHRNQFPTLLFRRVIHGIPFEFRLRKKDQYQEEKFVKTDADGEIVRIHGEVQYYTIEELHRLQIGRQYDYHFAVFDGEQQVGTAQDEWGCLLVVVAPEYRGFGLGPLLTRLAWEAEPGKDSGGCTPMGQALVRRVHGEFVRDYLQKGLYSALVREGQISLARAQEIVASADLAPRTGHVRNLNTNDPKDWLLYAEDGSFILYDKKLKDILVNYTEDDSIWMNRCIKAMAFVGSDYFGQQYVLHHCNGDTPALKKTMMRLAVSWTSSEGDRLRVFADDLDAVDPSVMTLDEEGTERIYVTWKGKSLDFSSLARAERQWRKSFDRYDEFRNWILELSESKYRD